MKIDDDESELHFPPFKSSCSLLGLIMREISVDRVNFLFLSLASSLTAMCFDK